MGVFDGLFQTPLKHKGFSGKVEATEFLKLRTKSENKSPDIIE